jgi:predicted dehydrogenase
MRLAVIGAAGRIAQTHLEAIAKVARIELVVVQDLRMDALGPIAKTYGCRTTADPAAVFADPTVDAVLICAPPVTHTKFIEDALRAGKHVMCEKPFTLSVKEAQGIKLLAGETGKLVMMASKFRFVTDVIKARELVRSGKIGAVVSAEVIFCSFVDMKNRWNSDPRVAGGGVLIDNGSHAVDLIRYLLGPIRSVFAQEGRKTQDLVVDDTARLHFETDDHVIGMVDLSWSLYKNTRAYVSLLGTKGTIDCGWESASIWDAASKKSEVFGSGYSKVQAFVSQMEHFAACVLDKATPILDVDDAMESVRVIEAAYTSIRESKWLKV